MLIVNSSLSILCLKSETSLSLSSKAMLSSWILLCREVFSMFPRVLVFESSLISCLKLSTCFWPLWVWSSTCLRWWVSSFSFLTCWLSMAFTEQSSALKLTTFCFSSSRLLSPSKVPTRTAICSYLSIRVFSLVLISLSRSRMVASFLKISSSISFILWSLICDSLHWSSFASSSYPNSLASFFSM